MANHKKSIRWASIKKVCHIEKCMDPIKSIEYCSKDGKVTEWGERPVFDKKIRATKAKDIALYTEEDFNEQAPRDYVLYKKV